MRIKIISVGAVKKNSPFSDLFDTYARRMSWSLDTIEIDTRKANTAGRQADKIVTHIPEKSYIFALDERGKTLSSIEFSHKLEALSHEGQTDICFIIGGADGLTENLRKKADFLMSFGKQTWPHQLVRVMLTEQIYRAQQICAGHPYHRE